MGKVVHDGIFSPLYSFFSFFTTTSHKFDLVLCRAAQVLSRDLAEHLFSAPTHGHVAARAIHEACHGGVVDRADASRMSATERARLSCGLVPISSSPRAFCASCRAVRTLHERPYILSLKLHRRSSTGPYVVLVHRLKRHPNSLFAPAIAHALAAAASTLLRRP